MRIHYVNYLRHDIGSVMQFVGEGLSCWSQGLFKNSFLVLSCSSICENMNVHEIWNGIKVQYIIIFVEIQRFYKIRGFATCNSLRQINSGFQWSTCNCISNPMDYIVTEFRCVVMFWCLILSDVFEYRVNFLHTGIILVQHQSMIRLRLVGVSINISVICLYSVISIAYLVIINWHCVFRLPA